MKYLLKVNGYDEALKMAGAEILAFNETGNYQGEWWAKVRYRDKESWVTGSYGTCSQCDSFLSEVGYPPGGCDAHWLTPVNDCQACIDDANDYRARVIDFAKVYLDTSMDQAEAEKKAAEYTDECLEAEKALDWLRVNAIGSTGIPYLRVKLLGASPDLDGFSDSVIWRDLPDGTFLRMLDLAIGEYMGIGICPQCRATRLTGAEYTEHWGRDGAQRCDRCNGSGLIDRVTDYAQYMSISKRQWGNIEQYFDWAVEFLQKGMR